MPINRFESVYSQLKDALQEAQERKGYSNLSKAFGAWYLQNQYGMNDSEIDELLIDGYGDNGIDAYLLNEAKCSLKLFQFKFPGQPNNIDSKVKQADMQKFIQGCRVVMHGSTQKRCSDSFLDMLEAVRNEKILEIELEIVAYNSGLTQEAEGDLLDYEKELKDSTGNHLTVSKYFRNDLSSLYEKSQHSLNLSLDMPFQTGMAAYNYGKEVQSHLCIVKALHLINAIGDEIVAINDENIRLFEGDTRINQGIKETASTEDGKYFYFYNNGVTLICDEYDVDPTKHILYAKGVSIVNGCQTVTCLSDLARLDQLDDEVMLLVRVISTTDYGLRANITEFLNSQNAIKDSYLLANHSIVRKLQKELIEKGFYLDRQFNEYKNKAARGIVLPDNVVPIELGAALQYYVGYFSDDNASLAKRNKGALFIGEKAEEILSGVTAEQIAKAWQIHEKVCGVITKYRKLRRNDSNTEFAEYMQLDQGELIEDIESYRFLNTADILLMNAVHALEIAEKTKNTDTDALIRKAVLISCDVIKGSHSDLAPASATKNSVVFQDIRNSINRDSN